VWQGPLIEARVPETTFLERNRNLPALVFSVRDFCTFSRHWKTTAAQNVVGQHSLVFWNIWFIIGLHWIRIEVAIILFKLELLPFTLVAEPPKGGIRDRDVISIRNRELECEQPVVFAGTNL
jgi:hypothetical protein